MGKKKGQQRVQQSMGQMVSAAALAQLGPKIAQYVQEEIKNLGGMLAQQSASTFESMFTRIVVLEGIVTEKLGYTKADLAEKVSNLEDEREGLVKAEVVELNDVVRIQIKTKTTDQAEYQGDTRLKISNTGSGQTIGQELEGAILGMKADEVKTVEFGADKQMVAEITVNRVSRPVKVEKTEEVGATDDNNQTPG